MEALTALAAVATDDDGAPMDEAPPKQGSRPSAHRRLHPRRVPFCGTLPLPSHRRFFCVI